MKKTQSIIILTILIAALATTQQTFAPQGPRSNDLYLRFYGDPSATYAALKAGDIDLMAFTGWSAGLPLHDGKQFGAELYADATMDPNIILAPIEGNDIVGFDFNNNATVPTYPGILSPISNRSFRQAIAFLVDKDFIVDEVKGGFGSRIDVPIPASQSSWWNPNVTGLGYPYPFSPVAAEALLDSRGYIQGSTPNPYYDPLFPGSAMFLRTYPSDHPQRPGWDLDPLIVYGRNDDLHRYAATQLLVDNMRKLGIPVTPIYGPESLIYGPVMGSRDYHIYTSGWIVKKWPIYLHKLYHSTFWHLYGANYVTGLNTSGLPNYPYLDHELDQLWFNTTYAGTLSPCHRAQQIMVDDCISVWLYSSRSYVAYRDLLGIVNMKGYGPVNKYTFMNAYKPDASPIRVGLVSPPNSLNPLYSDWIYSWIGLDRIYDHLLNEAPYDPTVDQPWLAQDWYVDVWNDPQDGQNKTRITFWLRENATWVQPITGTQDSAVTSHDIEFSVWFSYAFPDSWHWNDVMDVHHTRIVNDTCIEVYFNVLSYWATYWIGEQLPIIPKHLWLDAFCANHQDTVILDRDYDPCEKLMFTTEPVVQTIQAWLDGTPLVEGTDYNIVAHGGCHNWIHWLIPVSAGQNLTVAYWTPVGDPHGYFPGGLPWQTILEGSGMYYAIDFVSGVGGYLTLRRNPLYWLETPILGDIDFLWYWNGYDESRRVDSNRAPRHGCYRVDTPDVVLVSGAFGSQGNGVPSVNWFPGADLAQPEGQIDNFDQITVVGAYGMQWGCTGPFTTTDVAVNNVWTSKQGCLPLETVGQGQNITIYATVENQGGATATFNVTAFANSTLIGRTEVTLGHGVKQNVTHRWDTTGFLRGNYTISVVADPLPTETDTADNTLINGIVLVTLSGDVDGDGDVDIFDIVRMANIYGVSKPSPSYDPNCDLDDDDDIDIFDIVLASGNYGLSW